MKKYLLIVHALVLSMTCVTAQAAMSTKSHPKTFCDLASELGYPSRGFKDSTGGCASNMIDVTSTAGSNGLKNNLAFYASSEFDDIAKLMRVSMILNVNYTGEKKAAAAELARVAGAVAVKILGSEPQGFKAVIQKAGTQKWRSGEWIAMVETTRWPTGLGFDTKVSFKPAVK